MKSLKQMSHVALWGILDFKVAPEKKPHRPSQIFQLIFAQTYKISCQDVFFYRPAPSLVSRVPWEGLWKESNLKAIKASN